MGEQMMRGLVMLGNRAAEVRSFRVPEVGPGEVRFRVKSAGICGSDLHFYRDTPESLGDRLGVVIGHEPSGVVDAVGTGVSGFAPGDRVTVNHTLGCGTCEYCLGTETVLCPNAYLGMAQAGRGADADYCVMPAGNVIHLDDRLTFTDGSFLACTGATAWGAVAKARGEVTTGLLVFGLGPVGLSVVLVASAMGLPISAVDPNADRRAYAARVVPGFTVLHPDEIGPGSATPIPGLAGAPDAAIDTSGAAAAQRQALATVRPQGTVVLVGLADTANEQPVLDPAGIIHLEKRVVGSKVLPLRSLPALMRFLVANDLHFDRIVTRRVGLDDAPDAVAEFDRGAVGKFVIEL
jgi:threonine dehydrogenase-like Zn-dependent dehydrogenase